MALTIIRSREYADLDPKTNKPRDMIRLLIRDELGRIDSIKVPKGSSDEEIRKVWDAQAGRETPLTGREIK